MGSIEALPFPDASFDAVLSSLMLHHLADEGRRQGLEEIARVLKARGRFLAVDMGGAKRGKPHALPHRLRRHANFDLDELAPVFGQVDLDVIDRGRVGSPANLGLSNLRFILASASPARS